MNAKIKRIGVVGWLLGIFMLCSLTVDAEYHYGVKTIAEGETLTDNGFILYSSSGKTTITNNGTVNVTQSFTVYGNGEKEFINNNAFTFTGSMASFPTFDISGNSSFVNNGIASISGCYNFSINSEFINKGTLFLSDIESANLTGMKNTGTVVYGDNVLESLITALEAQMRETGEGKVMSREQYENSQPPSTEYKITYDLNGGSWKDGNEPEQSACLYTTEKQFYRIGEDTPFDKINENLVRDNYRFAGWICEEQGETEPAEFFAIVSSWRSDITLKAVWTPVPQFVFYHLAGGSFPEDIASPKIEVDSSGNIYTPFNVESEAFKLPEPIKKGYTFKGWGLGGTDKVFAEVTIEKGTAGNVAYTAEWEAKGNTSYTVNVYYMDKEGNYGNSPDRTSEEQGMTGEQAEVSASAYVKKGFVFDSSRSKNSGTISGDGKLTLSLYYKRNQHTITFKNYDGTEVIHEYTGYYGTKIRCPAAPEYTLADYICTFKGWSEEPESAYGITSPGNVEEDRTFYAAFEKEPVFCIVTLKKLTGFREPDTKTIKLDKGGEFSIKLSLADDKYYIGTKEWAYTFRELGAVYSDGPGGLLLGTDYDYTVSEDGRSVTVTIPSVTRNLDITACAQYHEEHSCSDKDDIVLKEASCSGKGRVRHFCYKCGKTYDADSEKDPFNHTGLAKTEAKPATYSEEGNIEYYYCTGCKKYFRDKAGCKEIIYADTVLKKLEVSEKDKGDMEANTVRLNRKAKVSVSGTKLIVIWGKVRKAAGYEIFAGKCGTKMKLVKNVKGGSKTDYSIAKIGKKKISPKADYKIKIYAYRTVKGKKQIIGKSLTLHIAGKDHKKYTNAKRLKLSNAKVTLKKGKTKKVTVKTVKQNRKKKLFPKRHVAACRYYSTDKSVAAVSKNGTIKGRKKGSCTVYAVAANGVKKGIKVTVK